MSGRIFLCYANAEPLDLKTDGQLKHLEHLNTEYEEVRSIFKPLEDSKRLRFDARLGIKNREDIAHYLTDQYCKDLLIFGFSGHASGKELMFEDEHIRSEALAKILSQKRCPYLKLVFLNGCLTQRSVHFFEQAKVPVIISTNSFMGDKNAMLFASTFFNELVNGFKTLSDAFENATRIVELDKQISGLNCRCYRTKSSILSYDRGSSWELAYRDEVCLEWKLDLGKDFPTKTKNFLEDTIEFLRNLEPFFSRGIAELIHCENLENILQTLADLSKQSKSLQLSSYYIDHWVNKINGNLSVYLEALSKIDHWLKDNAGREIAKDITSLREYISERVNL